MPKISNHKTGKVLAEVDDIKTLAKQIANSVYSADNDGEVYYSDEDIMDFTLGNYEFSVFVMEGSPLGSGYFALQNLDDFDNVDAINEEWEDQAPYYTFQGVKDVLDIFKHIASEGLEVRY